MMKRKNIYPSIGMAAKMFNQANAMADEYLKKKDSGDKYFGIQMKSEILQQTSTPKERIADFVCREREKFYKEFDPAPMQTYFGLAFQCAGALREMKQYSQALQIYQSGLDETLQGGHSNFDAEQFKQYKASFKFHKAYVLELNNDQQGAAVLYRELLDETQENGWQPYLDNGDAGGETIHARSLKRLEDIRRGVFREESEIRKSKLTIRMLF